MEAVVESLGVSSGKASMSVTGGRFSTSAGMKDWQLAAVVGKFDFGTRFAG